MANLFEQNRNYVLGDPELEIIGDRDSWRNGVTKIWGLRSIAWAARSSIAARI
jgi:hypothetical protein